MCPRQPEDPLFLMWVWNILSPARGPVPCPGHGVTGIQYAVMSLHYGKLGYQLRSAYRSLIRTESFSG